MQNTHIKAIKVELRTICRFFVAETTFPLCRTILIAEYTHRKLDHILNLRLMSNARLPWQKIRGSASHEIESMFVTAFFIKKITVLNKIILLAVFLRLTKN